MSGKGTSAKASKARRAGVVLQFGKTRRIIAKKAPRVSLGAVIAVTYAVQYALEDVIDKASTIAAKNKHSKVTDRDLRESIESLPQGKICFPGQIPFTGVPENHLGYGLKAEEERRAKRRAKKAAKKNDENGDADEVEADA